MTVHNLYLFDRNGVCLHYSEWHRNKHAGIPKEEEYKLMYGMLFSIRSFISKMSPLDMKEGFLAFQTSRYKLHYYETPTGLKVVMNTDLGMGSIRDVLHHIYSGVSSSPDPPPLAIHQSPSRLMFDTFNELENNTAVRIFKPDDFLHVSESLSNHVLK
ncbi:trafficking protein particle complex subunit 1-like [Tachyglossus aculeatus]|uniref:trafficking protein particle complex subunit 1-like n=1 Tax=Tachyglossus aculeatus TaxID=9261 RepID=UPI0018F3526B|nr:trafficking protein particle complex subunit 1-like [Tachyglossus aculeatus]